MTSVGLATFSVIRRLTDLDVYCTEKTYRKKSLMLHPDRFKAARGPEAFDLLKKAQTDLSNPDKRK